MSKKHFKACHKESGEVVEFDLGDIDMYCLENSMGEQSFSLFIKEDIIGKSDDSNIIEHLKDYHLQYLHAGEYHDYADERSEVKEKKGE